MYRSKKLKKDEMDKYRYLISDTYMTQINAGKFFLGLLIDEVGDKETEEALFITYSFAGWIELVWIKFFDEDALPIYKANLLRFIVRSERTRRGGDLKGAFCEIHTDEVKDPVALRQILVMSGFESRLTIDNIYDFTLGQVRERQFLKKAANALECVPLGDAGNIVLEELESLISEDARPVPVGMYPNWDDYLQEESVICMKNWKPCGVLLFSMKQDHLVIECAYVCDKMALACMVGRALPIVEEKYGPDQHVLVPIVLEKTGQLVERLVPDAIRGELLEAIKWF